MASVSDVLKRARELEKKGDWDGAALEYRKLQVTDPAPPIALNLLGDLYHKKGDAEESYAWYEKAIERYAQEGLYGNAIGICRKLLRQDRDRVEILDRLGRLFHSLGLVREAVNHYLLFAAAMTRRGEAEAVIEAAGHVREILPGDPKVREKLGCLLHELAAEHEALFDYQAALQAYQERGRNEEAERIGVLMDEISGMIGSGDQPVRGGPDRVVGDGIEATVEPSVEPHPVDLVSADQTGRDKESMAGFADDDDFVPVREILREFQDGVGRILDEKDHQSHYDMGMSYKEMGLYEEALREFDISSASPDHRIASQEMKVAILIELGRVQDGMVILEELLDEKDENKVGVHYLLGVAWEKQGERERALREYRIVERHDPHFRNVRERIARVEKLGVD